MFPNASCNSLPGTRGSRHNLDKRTSHNLRRKEPYIIWCKRTLHGDASDVFNWILSLNPGNTQNLTTLLQMLREHYCGPLTFREQRNTIDNLHQRPQEAAIDFLIRVGTYVSNLGKDWKDELMEKELQSLQYEVSLNGVKEEIRHVLDSKIAKNEGKLTPLQMYEAVKKYETYVARNKRLEG